MKQHLKTVTKPLHDWLESSSLFIQLTSNEMDKKSYGELLLKLYYFVNALESKLKVYEQEFIQNGLSDISQRLQKSTWLKKDLQELNIDIQESKQMEFLTLNNFSSAVGALYVIEGSTMGGMQIVKILKSDVQKTPLPTCYYSAYNEHTMPMWMKFAAWLDVVEIDQCDVTLGAMEAFIQLKKQIQMD